MSTDHRPTPTAGPTLTAPAQPAEPYICRDGSVLLSDGTLLNRHLLDRWDERTPASSVAPETAWRRGEWVRRPEVFSWSQVETRNDRCRVYHDPDGWLAVFPVREFIARTTLSGLELSRFERLYAAAHGPHGGDGR